MTDLRAAVQQLSQKHSAVHESAYMVEGDHLKAEMEKMAAAMEGTTTFVQEKCGSFEQELVVLETELHETCDRFQQQMVEIEMLFRALEHGQTAQPTHMPDSQQIV